MIHLVDHPDFFAFGLWNFLLIIPSMTIFYTKLHLLKIFDHDDKERFIPKFMAGPSLASLSGFDCLL